MAVFIGSVNQFKKKCTWCDRVTIHVYKGIEFGIGRFESFGYRSSSYNFLVIDGDFNLNINTEFKLKKDAIAAAHRKIDSIV